MSRNIFALLVMIVLGSVLFGWVETFSSSFQACISEQTGRYSKESPNETEAIIKTFAFSRCTGRFVNDHNGGITALASIVVAAFTATIWGINYSQLTHGRRVERAYVNGGWGRYIDGRLYANINNDGKTSATVHHMVLEILPLAGLPHTPPVLPRTFVNYNLEPYKRDFFSDHVFVEWDGLYEPARVLYGRFWYKDVFGEEHESGFLLHVQPRAPAVADFPEYWRWT
jgi:hypothetical protein